MIFPTNNLNAATPKRLKLVINHFARIVFTYFLHFDLKEFLNCLAYKKKMAMYSEFLKNRWILQGAKSQGFCYQRGNPV